MPLLEDNINTDQVAPVQEMRELKPDYRSCCSYAARSADGIENPDFVLNKPQFKRSRHPGGRPEFRLRVFARNGGVGDARERHRLHRRAQFCRDLSRELPAERRAAGGACPRPAEAFEQRVDRGQRRGAFTVDLRTQTISGPGGPDLSFDIPASDRTRLLEGLDDIGLTLKHNADIAAWEKRIAASQPWLQTAADSRGPTI